MGNLKIDSFKKNFAKRGSHFQIIRNDSGADVVPHRGARGVRGSAPNSLFQTHSYHPTLTLTPDEVYRPCAHFFL